MSLIHAFKWSFLSELASKLIQPLSFLILAKLLTPEDFGVVAAATMVITFTQIFWEAGMGKAVIQFQGDERNAQNTAFWINNILALLIILLLSSSAETIAHHIFHNPDVALVLQVMCAQIFMTALVSIHTAVMQKNFHFKHLFWIRLTTVAVPSLASIPLALYGWNYWALVIGTLLGQCFQVILLWRFSPWKPEWHFDPVLCKKLISFGGWVAFTALLLWFYSWFDSLIVSYYLGAKELGIFRVGNQLVTMIFTLLFGPILPVLYSHFSEIQNDTTRVKETLINSSKTITTIALTLAFFLFGNCYLIADLVFGEQWQGIHLVIASLALMHGFAWIVGLNGEAYRSLGSPNQETKIVSICFIFYIPGYFISIQQGFDTFVWARFLLSLLALVVHFYVAKRILNIAIKPYLKHICMLCALYSPIAALYFYIPNLSLLEKLATAAGCGVYGLIVIITLEKEYILELKQKLSGKVSTS